MMEEFSLLDTPASLTHLIRQTSKAVAGSTRNTPLAAGMLFTRINQMRAANEEGDMEALREAQQAALFEQGVLTAVDALRGDAMSWKNLRLLLRGKLPRAVAVPAAMAVAGMAAVKGLKGDAPAPIAAPPAAAPVLDEDAVAQMMEAWANVPSPVHSTP